MGIKELWRRVDGPIFAVVLLAACCAITYVVKDRVDSSAQVAWQKERAGYIKRFPEVRAEERASCTREYEAKLGGVQAVAKQQADDMTDMKSLMQTTNDLAAYTLRFLGDRAKINDQRTAAMLRQTQAATAAATSAAIKSAAVETKVAVAVVKADEAASAAKATEKKLDTATRATAAVPPTPWIGNRR
jgi:hypothetical protein